MLANLSFIFGSLACGIVRWQGLVWTFHLLWTFCSALWCIYDLVRYALEKLGTRMETRGGRRRRSWLVMQS
jgi:hypothetical protein